MNSLVNELSEARKELIKTVDKVNKNKVNDRLIGDWSLKDLVSHLTGWADYQISVLDVFTKGEVPPEHGKIDDFNQKSTIERKTQSWDKVYDEYKNKSQKLIDKYLDLPSNKWSQVLWLNKKTTPEKFIKIEIRHYLNTHLPQIKQLL